MTKKNKIQTRKLALFFIAWIGIRKKLDDKLDHCSEKWDLKICNVNKIYINIMGDIMVYVLK